MPPTLVVVLTSGIDLASQDMKTGGCRIRWNIEEAEVLRVWIGVTDAEIVDEIHRADKVGIDAPLGWPVAFAEAVGAHSRDGSWPVDYLHSDATAYRLRRTDIVTKELVGGSPPLSVSTDKIAFPAMRAAALLSRSTDHVALDGSQKVVEAYPAAALKVWNLLSRGYKRNINVDPRGQLIEAFREQTDSWLQMTDDQLALCRASDDAFDAVICALVARAKAVSLCEPIPAADHDAALREGWIAVPFAGTLARLVGG